MLKRLIYPAFLLFYSLLLAEPVERHGISFSGGWTGLPSFVKKAVASKNAYINLQGFSLGASYIYYGKGGPKGVFSGKYSFTYNRFNVLPKREDFVAQNADVYIIDVAAIWTILPSLPVNLYTGIGTGLGIIRLYNWDVTSPIADPEKVQEAKESYGNIPLPLPIFYIPVGINIRIKNFILNVETGLRDLPYLSGGFTYAFGKSEDVKIIKETVEVQSPPTTGRITGRVLEEGTNQPIGRAIIEMKGTGLTDLSASPEGAFTTPDIKAGEVELVASKEGYSAGSVKVTVEAGKMATAEILLQKESIFGAVFGRITDAQGKPLSASIAVAQAVTGGIQAEPAIASGTSDATSGEFFLKLEPGNYKVTASLQDYQTQTKDAVVKTGYKTRVDFTMEPQKAAPPPPPEKKPRVFIEKQKIVITETIYFESGKANILPVSFSILDEIAEILQKNPAIKIRIEGHTDSIGREDTNMRLSQARADSVMKYMLKKGVAPERMTAKGYGETMPIADNTSPDGRAKNRRVEFVITEQ